MDVNELICHLCGLNEDADYDEVVDSLWEKYQIDFENFEKLIKDILPLIDVGVSPLTKQTHKGFSRQADGVGFWLLKIEVK